MVCFSIATLIHPSIGLFSLSFFLLCTLPLHKKQHLITTGISFVLCIIALSILKIVFGDKTPISTAEFIDVYITRHAAHYRVSEFLSLTPFSKLIGSSEPTKWYINFILVISLLATPLLYAIKKRIQPLLYLTTLFLLSYVGAVFLQYLFIDIWPNKLIAIIGSCSLLNIWLLDASN